MWYNGVKFDRGKTTAKKKKVVQTRDKRVYEYELVYIVNPEATEESLESTVNGVSQFVTSKQGVVSEVERWGKKRLAYPVKHFLEGNYVVTRFSMDPSWSKELEANLRISEPIIRHMLVRLN